MYPSLANISMFAPLILQNVFEMYLESCFELCHSMLYLCFCLIYSRFIIDKLCFITSVLWLFGKTRENSVSPIVNCLDFAATVTAFFCPLLLTVQDKTEEFFLQRLRISTAGSGSPPFGHRLSAFEPLGRAIFDTTIFGLWSKFWGVVRLLSLRAHIPRKGPASTTTRENSRIQSTFYCKNASIVFVFLQQP